jgi:hypothetical protein
VAPREAEMSTPMPLDLSLLRWRRWRLLVPLVAVIVLAPACTASAPKTRIVPASELTWTDVMDPNGLPLGLRTVDVWGNAHQGAHGSMTKFPAGFAEPLHRHSNPIRVVVLSGIIDLTDRGNASEFFHGDVAFLAGCYIANTSG